MKRVPTRMTVLSVTAAIASVLVFCPRADAQITVPASTFPAPGDTLKLAIDNAPGACAIATYTPPGGNQTWDLNCLNVGATQDIVYRPASQGSATVTGATMFAVVPPSTFDGTSPTTEEYYNVSNDAAGSRFQLLASYGKHYNLATNSVFSLLPPLPERYAPMNFFDIKQASSGTLQAFAASAVPTFLPVTADSVRYRVSIQELSVVDAWGTMTIPGGSYPVLREKRTSYTEARIDAKVPPLGWLDVTDNAIQAGFIGLGVDTVVHFNYYNDASKEPIASLQLNTAQDAVVKATFKRVQPVCQNDGDPCGDPTVSACNLADTCLAGVCVPNYVAAGSGCGSNAATTCTSPDTCNGAGACVPNDRPNGTACSDGNACTTGDSCQNGTCAGGAPPNCNDNNACTIDSCSPATGCVSQPDPVCTPQIALLTAVQQVESCAPANGVLDPGERVTYAVTLKNNGSQPTTNLVATLLASASVNSPSGAQSYGAIPAGGTATRSFTWTGIGACGAPWSAALALADGAQSIPAVNVSGTYGAPGGVCNTGCAVVRIATRTVFTRNPDGTVRATVTVSNTGSIQANNVVLTSALLGTGSGTPLPRTLSSIPPGASTAVTVTFPSSVLAGANVLRLGGTYSGGTFSSSLRVTVP